MPATECPPTIGVIAERLGRPLHKIEYIIKARKIWGIGRAGNARLFSEDDVRLIALELQRIDTARAGEVAR
jgi:hypothetical protein